MRKINKAEAMEELLTISKSLVDNTNSKLEQGKPIDRIARDLRNLQYAQIKLTYIRKLCSDLDKASWQSIELAVNDLDTLSRYQWFAGAGGLVLEKTDLDLQNLSNHLLENAIVE